MTFNNTKMLYGDYKFLSTILLKLSGAVNGRYLTLSCLFRKSSNIHAIQCSYGGTYGLKEHRNVLMVIKCFCLQYY